MSAGRVVRCLLLLVLCLGAATSALAQGDAAVHGTVTARADGSTLPGATAELQGDALSAPTMSTTAADGHFVFPSLAPAEYVLIVFHPDFREQRYRLSLKPREVYNLEVALELRPVQEAVKVAAAPLPSLHAPGSTHFTEARLAEIPLTQPRTWRTRS